MLSKLLLTTALVSAIGATSTQAGEITVDAWLGGIQFEDDVDVDALTANALGGTITNAFDVGGGKTGFVGLTVEQNSGDFGSDNDHTLAYSELFFGVSESRFFAYGAIGQSEDTGDSYYPAPYGYAGLGSRLSLAGMDLVAQGGGVASTDEYGETIQSAVYVGVDATVDFGGGLSGTAGATKLFGERWNSSTPTSGTIQLTEYRLGLAYAPDNSPISYWAEYSNADYATTNESNSPMVSEIRVGITYRFGGGASSDSRVNLPNVGRWISVSVNEIE